MEGNHRGTEATEEVGFSLAGRPAPLALLAWWAGGGQGKETAGFARTAVVLEGGHHGVNDLTGEVIGAAIEVHKALGPGLLESISEECICIELHLRGITLRRGYGYGRSQAKPKAGCGSQGAL